MKTEAQISAKTPAKALPKTSARTPAAFAGDQRGNIAILFALLLIPLFGAAGMALDYTRASTVRSAMQAQADSAALNAAVAGPGATHAGLLAQARAEIAGGAGGSGRIGDLSVSGHWANATDFVVDISGTVATAMVHIVPGVDEGMAVSVQAVARLSQETAQYEPPTVAYLDPEAGDYNQIYVYCFDYESSGPKAQRRSQMTLIADNDGNDYDFVWPQCGEGEALSFRMRNVRHARTYPHLWNNPNLPPYRAEYDYYTDTALIGGAEQISVSREATRIPQQWRQHHPNGGAAEGLAMVETVRCDSVDECKPQSQGGVIPSGTNRDPHVETRACEPGKYMYFGWEDRPSGMRGPSSSWTDPAWTDRDYDDIRILMRCPVSGGLGEKVVRLIK